MKYLDKILVVALVAVFTSVWAVPSEAGRGYRRGSQGRHLSRGHFSRGHFSYGFKKNRIFREGHRLPINAPHFKSHGFHGGKRSKHFGSRHRRGRHFKSHGFRGLHGSFLGYSYPYYGGGGPQVVVVEPAPRPEPQVVVVQPPPEPEPENQWEIVTEWVPPVMERVKVPGYWANGIKKTWTGTHWKYETDRDSKVWVEETFEWQEKQEGYYKESQVLVK